MARNGKMSRRQGGRKARNGDLALRDTAPLFRAPRNVDHHFVRSWDLGNLSAPTSDGGWGYAFQLDQLPNYLEFSALYDFYKIRAVEVIWELTPTAAATTKTSNIMPVVLAYPDYDDSTAPASLSDALQASQMERLQLSEARTSARRMIMPHVSYGVAGAATNLGGSQRSGFIDCSYAGVGHFGVKFWIKNFNSTTLTETGATVALSFRFHLTMRNPR